MTEDHSCQSEAPAQQNNSPESSVTRLESKHPTRVVFQAVSGLFSRIFAQASIVKVDPLRCIPIESLKSRPICRWGVKKLKKSILGRNSSESIVNGVVSTGTFSVIAEVPEEDLDLVMKYLEGRGETHEKAEVIAAPGNWFHTVEGSHVHGALVESIKEFSETFAGFRWPVVEISWQPAEGLRAISIMCNEMHKDDHIVDFLLPDAMQSLKDTIDIRLTSLLESSRGFFENSTRISRVPDAYLRRMVRESQ